uniref:Uncharacterized protein n=1 Tax=Streptomyces sp. NBC_01393 TaxID=2903851 RepID=A0AAU3IA94_9ACTN
MIALLHTKWDVGLESWADSYGCDLDRAAIELGYYLSSVSDDLPGWEDAEAWAYLLRTGPARVKDGRIILHLHFRLDVDPVKWRDMREEWDRGVPLVHGVRRDVLRYFAWQMYTSGAIAETDAVMTVKRAREGRRPWQHRIPEQVLVHRRESRMNPERARTCP